MKVSELLQTLKFYIPIQICVGNTYPVYDSSPKWRQFCIEEWGDCTVDYWYISSEGDPCLLNIEIEEEHISEESNTSD